MDFYKRASLAVRSVPKGRVATYGQIALLCGVPNYARQVGHALNGERLGQVPAHRIVNSRGILSGAAAFETFDMQRLLLQGEGVETEYTEAGWKTDLARFGWKNTMEKALEFREIFERKGI